MVFSPRLRRPRRRARGRARGDRDVRGHPAGPRARPDRRGGLRRPPARAGRVIGTAEVISTRRRGALARLPPRRCTRRRTSSSPPPGSVDHDALVELVAQALERRGRRRRPAPARPAAARRGAAAGAALPAQGHRAVPRLPRRARRLALRPAPLRRLDPRRDPRRLGLVAALPGDPREARARLLGLQLRAPSTPTPARSASTSARARTTSPRRSRSPSTRSPTSPPATSPTRELERAKENLKGRIAALDGVDLGADEPARQVARSPTPRSSRSSG